MEIKYNFFENCDFVDSNHIEFNSKEKGVRFDFCSTHWLGILLVNHIKGDELLNIFIAISEDRKIYRGTQRLVIQFLDFTYTS